MDGGSDAYLVLEDANLGKLLATLGRLQNNGQTCIAAKRFIVLDEIYDILSLHPKMKAAKWVNLRMKHRIMVRWQGVDELHEQVLKTVAGGSLSLEDIFDQNGAYYPATILADLQPGMEGFDNELFGPVACDSAKDDNRSYCFSQQSIWFGFWRVNCR
jgi:succinate-semialdehyde dehydrogenase/glutarate-semialdehyde dehydrogenase